MKGLFLNATQTNRFVAFDVPFADIFAAALRVEAWEGEQVRLKPVGKASMEIEE